MMNGNDWVSSTFEDLQSKKLPSAPEAKYRRKREIGQEHEPCDQDVTLHVENKMWIDRYKPELEDDLAVHRNKIMEVDAWMESGNTNGSKVLVISGPVGSGKTATVQVLASKFGFTCKEWSNPVTTPFEMLQSSGLKYQSQLNVFHDFLFRCGRYSSVLNDDPCQSDNRDLIILEELPYIFEQNPSQLKDLLLKYQQASNLHPLVVISSDGNSNTFVRQLPPNIRHISFNPVASTLMVKALKRIANNEGYKLASEEAKQIAANGNGDIRASIFSLQFSLQRVPSMSKKKPSSKKVKSCAVLQKDPNINIFRAIGKILYCKRQEVKPCVKTTINSSTDPLVIEPEDVLDQCCLTGSTFSSYLHHNYLPIFTKNSIHDVANASECFSVSDMLASPLVTVDPSHGASRMLDFYQGVICARGLIDSNSLRKTHAACTKSTGSFNPLHKPAWTGVSKERADNYIVAQSLFWKFRQSSSELISSTLPYLLQLNTFNSSPPERMFLQKVIAMSSKFYSTFNHDENDDNEVKDDLVLPTTSSVKNEIPDEDVEIDDFSD